MEQKEDCFHLGVKALIYNGEGKVLLLQMSKRDLWDIPGGRMQKGESLEETLKREVYEETGLQNIVRIVPLTMTLSNIRIRLGQRDVGLIYAAYVCEVERNCAIRLSSEHKHFDWFEPEIAAGLLSVAFPLELTEKIANLRSKYEQKTL